MSLPLRIPILLIVKIHLKMKVFWGCITSWLIPKFSCYPCHWSLLYVERTIAIYDLFQTISRIGSCISNSDVTWFKYLNHCILFVKQGCNMIKLFESLDLVCQTWMYHDSNMLFWSWEVCAILPTYQQIWTFIHH
jgi:hypothetical protein